MEEKNLVEGKVAAAEEFLYELKPSLVTDTEMGYMNAIKQVLPENCILQAQANLATFIVRTDQARFQNELYRNVDFIITDLSYKPLLVIEINDKTHLTKNRQERDKKVANICEEAGIPIINLWTSYGVNPEYIEKRITEALSALPAERIHHFVKENGTTGAAAQASQGGRRNGCYIATYVYGSYDCPQVWTLRRFRDERLKRNRIGCAFIRLYYAVSPKLVRWLGKNDKVRTYWKTWLDLLVWRLQKQGIPNTPYVDENGEGNQDDIYHCRPWGI